MVRLTLCDAAPPWGLQSPAAAAAIAPLEVFLADYDLTWQAYLESRGFPRAVAEHFATGAVSGAFCEDLAASLHRDVDTQAPADSAPVPARLISERQIVSGGVAA